MPKKKPQKLRLEKPTGDAIYEYQDFKLVDLTVRGMEQILNYHHLAMELTKGEFTNRNLSDRTAELYAVDMKAGNWDWDSWDPICIDTHGRVIDGQHRLRAMLVSQKTGTIMLYTGCDPDSFAKKDRGKRRNASDMLSIMGWNYTTMSAGLIRGLWMLTGEGTFKSSPTNDVVVGVANDDPSIQETAGQVEKWRQEGGRNMLNVPTLAALYHAVYASKPRVAERFFKAVVTGIGLEDTDDPAFRLRKFLTEYDPHSRPLQRKCAAIMVLCWNARFEGRKLKKIAWKGNSFPSPKGWSWKSGTLDDFTLDAMIAEDEGRVINPRNNE